MQKAELQPEQGQSPDDSAVDETVIRIDNQRYWLYTAVDPKIDKFHHMKLVPSRNSGISPIFFRELKQKHDVYDAVFLVGGAQWLQQALRCHGLTFRHDTNGQRNTVGRL